MNKTFQVSRKSRDQFPTLVKKIEPYAEVFKEELEPREV